MCVLVDHINCYNCKNYIDIHARHIYANLVNHKRDIVPSRIKTPLF